KMDLPGTKKDALMEQLRTHLSEACVDFSGNLHSENTLDALAMCQEQLMEEFLETGDITDASIAEAIARRKVFPCCFGSALKLEKIDAFLSCLSTFTRMPDYGEEFGARVFKISRDSMGNRLSFLKVTGGTLPVRTVLSGEGPEGSWQEKISGLRIYSGAKFTQTETATAGMVVAATGLQSTRPGMGLGFEEEEPATLLRPVLTYRVGLPQGFDPHRALSMLRTLEEEEPQLHVTWNEGLQELRVQLMGTVQLEIIKELLRSRFGLEVELEQGSILYQETIASTVEGVGHFEPLRHYAEVHLLLEPGEQGSGLVFATEADEDALERRWQRLILTHLMEKTHVGVLTGSPITDLKITLMSGKAHTKHTEGGDFRQATYRAIRQGLMQAESVLLEPWYSYRLEVPMANVGRAITDLQRMNGSFQQGDTVNGMTLLTGSAPVALMRDYPLEVASYTHGLGRISCTLEGYKPCHNQQEVVEAMGYNPTADTLNTPDSVFCSHGAGVVVPWNDVPEHMHLPSCLGRETEDENDTETGPRTWEQRARDYVRHVATDKELQAIFERTYGPIKRTEHNLMRTRKAPSDTPKQKAKPNLAPTGPEYLLVDGYNIIFAWDDLKELAKERLELARDTLIDRMVNYQGVRQCELILVFDAYRVKGGTGSVQKVGGINVVYTKEAETADMYIERVTHQIGKGKKVRVATSDGLVQMIILGHGALRIPASSFQQEVREAEQIIWGLLQQPQ
ncbi:MAG: NYN domain-containing protein, partial [Oscillospiraceae bacterium]|nr:NYN domain-containing protein [Oscillospiraceae bacterium]